MSPGRGSLAVVGAAAVALGLVGAYLALGGGTYRPLEVADPCEPRQLTRPEGLEAVGQQVVLSALDGAACRLRVTREDLALGLASPEARERFAAERRLGEDQLEKAVRSGLERAVDDSERAGLLSGIEASLLRAAVGRLPVSNLFDILRTGRGLTDELGGLLGR